MGSTKTNYHNVEDDLQKERNNQIPKLNPTPGKVGKDKDPDTNEELPKGPDEKPDPKPKTNGLPNAYVQYGRTTTNVGS